MKLTLPRQTFVQALLSVQSSSGWAGDAAMPFANARIAVTGDLVEVAASSQESAAKKKFNNKVSVEGEPAPFAVNFKRLLEAAKLLPGDEIVIEVTDRTATLRGTNGSVRLPLYDAPDAVIDIWNVELQGAGTLFVSAKSLRDAIMAVEHASDKDGGNGQMLGICLDVKPTEMHVVGTDGKRMAIELLSCEFGAPVQNIHFVIQPQAIEAVRGMLESFGEQQADIQLTEHALLAKSSDERMQVRVIGSSGSFVQWELPAAAFEAVCRVNVPADDLIGLLRRAIAITGQRTGATLSLDLDRKALVVKSEETESGSTDGFIPWTEIDGGPYAPMMINPRFLMDAIESFPEKAREEVAITFGTVGHGRGFSVAPKVGAEHSARYLTSLAK